MGEGGGRNEASVHREYTMEHSNREKNKEKRVNRETCYLEKTANQNHSPGKEREPGSMHIRCPLILI